VTGIYLRVCAIDRAQQRPWVGRQNSGSEDGGDGAGGGIDACWAAPPTASLGDALAAALAKAGTQTGENNKKKVGHQLLLNRTPNPWFNPGFTPTFIYHMWGVIPELNPGFGVLRCEPLLFLPIY
jgi:hypothetical protein